MSLSESERKELEKLRADKESQRIWKGALGRGLILSFVFIWISPYFTLDNVFGRRVGILGTLVCLTVGILSSYYGPFKEKKAK